MHSFCTSEVTEMSDLNRRQVLRAAAWSAPVVMFAVAVPAASASQVLVSRIEFTNVTATVGAKANTIYGNTKVKVLDGPEPVVNLRVIITINGETRIDQTFATVNGWGDTGIIQFEKDWYTKGADHTVSFYATADGVEPIFGTVTVTGPGWWA